ncbi:hypothetical protein [Archangium sp.]|uniref:hypothetical protein n=1 Tax=Archangium sp. TaxID=1872627 RepID=UPI002D34233F|nr:hypothetical protein [Archangium sp.]HYO54897.1 hypothetical protein [Archangium sp.]
MAHLDFQPSWSGPAREVLERAIERHGGWSTWQRLHSVTLGMRLLRGMLPTLKGNGRTFLLSPRFMVRPREMEAELVDYPTAGSRGLFARGEVRLMETHGATTAHATAHRDSFRGLSKYRRWSPLDALYFFGYALTHYHSLPFTLGEGQCLGHRHARLGNEVLDGVVVRLPPSLHTHCELQVFYFDSTGLLRRHDYVAEIAGAWARGAHFWEDYVEVEGLSVARRRHVVARLGGQPLPPFVALHAEFDSVEVRLGEALSEKP